MSAPKTRTVSEWLAQGRKPKAGAVAEATRNLESLYSLAQTEPMTGDLGDDPIFGKVVYAYTRKQALEDGEQVDVTTTALEAGIKIPTFLSRAVWDAHVALPKKYKGMQSESGRLWDICWMLSMACRRNSGDKLQFQLTVSRKLVTLKAVCAALDIDDPQPSITVMKLDED